VTQLPVEAIAVAVASPPRPFGRASRDAYAIAANSKKSSTPAPNQGDTPLGASLGREAGRAAAEGYFFIGMAIMSGCIFIISMHFMSFIIMASDIPWHFTIIVMSASDMFIFFIMFMHFMSFIIMSWDMPMQEVICILSASAIIIGLFIGIVWGEFVWAQPATVLAIMATAMAVILKAFMG
jgi:hypothetical protein